jgi:hypothetical protein
MSVKTQKYKLKSGAEISGTVEQILATAKAVGETVDLSRLDVTSLKGYYKSDKMGLIKISDMNEMHLRNAIIKQTKRYFESLVNVKGLTKTQWLQKYVGLAEDSIIVELTNELIKR